MNTNGIVDILNALPTSKLISTVSAGIGKLYEPTHIKRIAKAKAEEIKLISGAMEECSVIPTQYNDGSLTLNNTDWDDFVRRTQGRMAFQELQKQNNIECVVANAYNILEKEQTCSEESVEQGWINRFFDSVATVSDEDLQQLWGKVLAGEIKQPKSYSLRTLETLKNLSKHEATLFQKIAPFVLREGNNHFIVSNNDILKKHDLNYHEILQLDECGLINSGISVSLQISLSNTEESQIFNKCKMIVLKGLSSSVTKVSVGDYGLTRAGIEILSLIDFIPDDSIVDDVFDLIVKKSPSNLKMAIHKVNFIRENSINYDLNILREFQEQSPKKMID